MRTITISEWVSWGRANADAWHAAYRHGRAMQQARHDALAAEGLAWAQIRIDPEYAAITARCWAIHAWLNTPEAIVPDAFDVAPMRKAA